ncbi:hypothetical protein D3C77_301600 [compost metagenome]
MNGSLIRWGQSNTQWSCNAHLQRLPITRVLQALDLLGIYATGSREIFSREVVGSEPEIQANQPSFCESRNAEEGLQALLTIESAMCLRSGSLPMTVSVPVLVW